MHNVAGLLLFFSALSYYLPVEPGTAGAKDDNFLTGLCTGYVPAPLGDDLFRFNRLLREMETARSDELARLFSAAKAPMAAGQAGDRDETSAGSVYSALQKDGATKNSIRYKERLWQARLVLKLAEMLDTREKEIRQGLAHIAAAEQKVFAALEGRDTLASTDMAEAEGLAIRRRLQAENISPAEPAREASGQLLPLQVKAWAELYLADSSDQRPVILVAANPESGSLLLDGYENGWRRNPEKLFSLPTPPVDLAAMKETPGLYRKSRNTFQAAAAENIQYFAHLLEKTASRTAVSTDVPEAIPGLAANVSAWGDNVQNHFPGLEKGGKKLDFYCFPGVAPAELLQRIFRLEGPIPQRPQASPTALLAILRP